MAVYSNSEKGKLNMKIRQLLYCIVLVIFSHLAVAQDCGIAKASFEPLAFCKEQKLTEDLLVCAEVAKGAVSPSAAVEILEICKASNEACLRKLTEYISDYQLKEYYSELIEYLMLMEGGNKNWINNAIAMIYMMRAGEEDFLKAEEKLIPLVETGYRMAIGNMASLRHSQKRYSESINILESLKSNEALFYGDALHVMQYAQHYHFGNGVKKDLLKAQELYEKVMGRVNNGVLEHLLADTHIDQGEFSRGMELLHESMSKGLYQSADILASFYLVGKHVEKDYKIALEYLKIAARLGSPTALANQGILYNHLGEIKKAKIALIAAALINQSETAKRALKSSNIDPENYRCTVVTLFASPDNFLFKQQ